MKNCIEISEDNLLNFLKQEISLDKDSISPFLKEKEKDLNKNNIYNYLNDKQYYSEKIYNNINKSSINNYIINSNPNDFKFRKIKINNNSDLSCVKNILLSTNSKDEFFQDQIKQITITNISKEDFNYLFNKKSKIKKKNRHYPSMILENKEDSKHEKGSGKLSSNNVRRTETEFIIVGEDKNDESEFIDIEFNYPNIDINNCNLTDIKLNDIFANAKKLKITSCILSNDFYNIFEKNSFINLSELYLDNCNIVNENFTEIIYYIIKNETLRKHLKCISFKNNNLSTASFYKYILDGNIQYNKFDNLEMIDLSYNDIDSIDSKIMGGLPNLKVLDLSNNNFQFPSKFSPFYSRNEKNLKKKKTIKEESQKMSEILEKMSKNKDTPQEEEKSEVFLFFISNNIALLRGNHINTYVKYLIDVLPKIDYPLKNINLSGLFYKSSIHHLIAGINFKKLRNSLMEIDLSNCNITDEEMEILFVSELRVINLKILNIANNKLTDELFSLLVKNKSFDIYNKLKIINLSNNDIKLNKVKDLTNFVKLFDSIKIIIINNTPAENNINNYIKKVVKRFNETQNGDKNKTELNDVDMLIQELLEKKDKNNYLFNNSNIKLKMKNTIDYKFVEAAQKIYPDLFDKIIIEYKLAGPN